MARSTRPPTSFSHGTVLNCDNSLMSPHIRSRELARWPVVTHAPRRVGAELPAEAGRGTGGPGCLDAPGTLTGCGVSPWRSCWSA